MKTYIITAIAIVALLSFLAFMVLPDRVEAEKHTKEQLFKVQAELRALHQQREKLKRHINNQNEGIEI